jgi:two-component system, OmpR family, sensor kinase
MASLRTRILLGVVGLCAVGLVLLAFVTYTEERSFLLDRVDQQVKGAAPAVSEALDAVQSGGAGRFGPGGAGPGAAGGSLDGDRGDLSPRRGAPKVNLPPPGTYGQRRTRAGKVVHDLLFSYGQAAPPAPQLPAHLPVARLLTVGSSGSSGLRYRVFVSRDPEDTGLTLVAVPLRDIDQTLSRLRLIEALVILGVLCALGVGAFFLVRLGLRPLDRMQVTAGQIAAGDLSRRVSPATPRTEVGRLGLALNAMLERLERAFAQRAASEERLRQFLADASHELRTPLASIRGYAELFRMGAARDEHKREVAMRRIEEESARMGTLVEDLLTLAHLDEERAIERTLVDVASLARDAVADAHATAPERSIGLDAPATAVVSGDSHQLRTVLANLLRNALVHTPPRSAIEVAVSDSDGRVVLSVRDHGKGLPPGSPARLFDRFWRAQPGRERGRGGAGLGLAIVDDVVRAHGGSVRADNADGGGAVFVVELPKSAPPVREADANA